MCSAKRPLCPLCRRMAPPGAADLQGTGDGETEFLGVSFCRIASNSNLGLWEMHSCRIRNVAACLLSQCCAAQYHPGQLHAGQTELCRWAARAISPLIAGAGSWFVGRNQILNFEVSVAGALLSGQVRCWGCMRYGRAAERSAGMEYVVEDEAPFVCIYSSSLCLWRYQCRSHLLLRPARFVRPAC